MPPIAGYANEEGPRSDLVREQWGTLLTTTNKKKFLERDKDELKVWTIGYGVLCQHTSGRPGRPACSTDQEGVPIRFGANRYGSVKSFVETLRWESDANTDYMTQASVRPTYVRVLRKRISCTFQAAKVPGLIGRGRSSD